MRKEQEQKLRKIIRETLQSEDIGASSVSKAHSWQVQKVKSFNDVMKKLSDISKKVDEKKKEAIGQYTSNYSSYEVNVPIDNVMQLLKKIEELLEGK